MELRGQFPPPQSRQREPTRLRESSREIRGGSQPEIAYTRRVRRVVVESLSRFLAEHPCQHHSFQQRWRCVAALSVFGEHDLGDLVNRVEADEVEQGKRSHRMARSQLHTLIDVFDRSDLRLQ